MPAMLVIILTFDSHSPRYRDSAWAVKRGAPFSMSSDAVTSSFSWFLLTVKLIEHESAILAELDKAAIGEPN